MYSGMLVIVSLGIMVIIYQFTKRKCFGRENSTEPSFDLLKEDFKPIKEAPKKHVPSDYNDKQVLTKYNKGTYRDGKGRYASLPK
jgi:hypothetical protein